MVDASDLNHDNDRAMNQNGHYLSGEWREQGTRFVTEDPAAQETIWLEYQGIRYEVLTVRDYPNLRYMRPVWHLWLRATE